jgi:hypothetical protein
MKLPAPFEGTWAFGGAPQTCLQLLARRDLWIYQDVSADQNDRATPLSNASTRHHFVTPCRGGTRAAGWQGLLACGPFGQWNLAFVGVWRARCLQ